MEISSLVKESSVDSSVPNLEQVQQEFLKWRSHRKFGSRIPESLWELALSLRDSYPTGKITCGLGLGWNCFQKRLNAKQGIPHVSSKSMGNLRGSAPSFLELKMSENLPFSPPTSPCLLELSNSSGCQLRIYASALSYPSFKD